MTADGELREFGDVEAAAAAFESLPMMVGVTDGPELTAVAFNAATRASTQGRWVYGRSLVESLGAEMVAQQWQEPYLVPTLTGETVTVREQRAQVEQPDGSVDEMYVDAVFSPRLDADGRPRGTILVAHDVTQRVRDRIELARELEELRERYSAAQGSVRAMQSALLADSVPVLSDFDVAAHYVLASDEQAAGGDWFDAVARDDGSVVLVVGDVVGHGKGAAVAMGQLRSVLLSQLRAGVDVAEAVTFLDGFAAGVRAARRATVCVVHVHPDGAVEYCTAGHPPPLVLASEDSDSHYLTPTGAGPLATGSAFPTSQARLGEGEAVVLYTDGVLERPGASPATAPLELRSTAGDARRNLVMPFGASRSPAERICSLTIELLTRMHGHTDDITILAAQRRAPVPALELALEASSESVRVARAGLRAWLEDLVPEPETVGALLQVATELVANVVDHAFLGREPQPFRLGARLDGVSQVVLEVADTGSWKLPLVTGRRGLGLALVRQLVDELLIDRTSQGTTASARVTLSRPAGLLVGPRPAAVRDPEFFDVWAKDGPEPVVTVLGPLDAATVPELASCLEIALTEAGAVATVDLTSVTLLASAGVDLLFRIGDQARALGLELEILAPNGSPAQQVLSLVRLPHQHAPAPARPGPS